MTDSTQSALAEARRRERLTQAEWRRHRAEVARLIAAGEEAAAEALLDQAGAEPTATTDLPPRRVRPSTATVAPPAKTPTQPRRPSPKSPAKAPTRPNTAPKLKPLPAPPRRRRKRRTWVDWLRERPPWAVSLATHGVLIALFGLLTFATFSEPAFSLSASLGDDAAWDEMPAEVTLAELPTELDSADPLDTPLDTPLDLAAEMDLESLVEPVSFEPTADLGPLGGLSAESLMAAVPAAGGKSDGTAESTGGGKPAKSGASGRVSFFGSESEAERVVFVVDNSGSMQRGRMETTLLELEQAVTRLAETQSFYVVFFSDQAYPMFFPDAVESAVPATRENKRRLSKWLHTVEVCLGGRLLDAMELAAGLEPDVVYLLTDGDIRSERIAGRMTAPDAWPFTIHTLGMGARTRLHAEILHRIASNTGGVYRPVAAHPAAVARARLRPIPYHRTPGDVWGSAVQSWD